MELVVWSLAWLVLLSPTCLVQVCEIVQVTLQTIVWFPIRHAYHLSRSIRFVISLSLFLVVKAYAIAPIVGALSAEVVGTATAIAEWPNLVYYDIPPVLATG